MTEIYFSHDVESNGPLPGPNSMLSFALVPILSDGTKLQGRSWNLKEIDGSRPDSKTMSEFWNKPENQDAYKRTREGAVAAELAMTQCVDWVKGLAKQYKATPVLVEFPGGYDFLFLYWYMIRFAGESPFSFSTLGMKAVGWAYLHDQDFRGINKRVMLKHWPSKQKHTHVALDDASEQGDIFIGLLKHREFLKEEAIARVEAQEYADMAADRGRV